MAKQTLNFGVSPDEEFIAGGEIRKGIRFDKNIVQGVHYYTKTNNIDKGHDFSI